MSIPSTHRARIIDVTEPFAVAADVAFDYLTDPDQRSQWQSSLRGVRRRVAIGARPGDVGTSWSDVTVVPGMVPRMEVIERQAPTRWTEIGRWGPLDAKMTLEVAATGPATCEVRATADLTVPILLAPTLYPLGVFAGPAIAADLRTAARVLTSRHQSNSEQGDRHE